MECYEHLIKILLVGYILQCGRGGIGASKPEIRVNIHQNYLILHCEVATPLAGTNVFLACPLMNNGVMCFENCRHMCDSLGPSCNAYKKLSAIRCTEETINGRLVFSYVIDSADASNEGPWHCSYGGVPSASVRVEAYARPPLAPTQPTGIKTGQNRLLEKSSSKEKPKSSIENSRYDHILRSLTSFELVIGVFCLLGMSVIINVAFLIRCCLLKRYLRSEKKPGHRPSRCLEICICIPRSRRAPPVPYGQPHHRGDTVYEDLNSPAYYVGLHPTGGLSNLALNNGHSGGGEGVIRENSYPVQNRMVGLPDEMNGSTILVPAGFSQDGSMVFMVPATAVRSQSTTGLRASQILYDEVPHEPSNQNAGHNRIRQASSTGNLYSRTRRSGGSASARPVSPLPEEMPLMPMENGERRQPTKPLENGTSEDPLRDSQTGLSDPRRLERSRTLVQRADSLLREAEQVLYEEQD